MHGLYGKEIETESQVYPDTVLIAVASSRRLVLTKRQLEDGSFKSNDHVGHFNFYERKVDNLLGLYRLLTNTVNFPRAALIRAVLKDANKSKHIKRLFKGEESTLVNQDQHWFALDIDGFGESSGDLKTDAQLVLKGLGKEFGIVDCIALASSSYGFKPKIHIRLFFWSDEKVSSYSLKKFFYNNKVCADINLFNPVQLIYVAKPILLGADRVERRLLYLHNDYPTVIIPESFQQKNFGGVEKKYTKPMADIVFEKIMGELQFAQEGTRHTMLYEKGCFLGKLIAQGLLDEETVYAEVEVICEDEWHSNNLAKDRETLHDGIERGRAAIEADDEESF